MTADAVGGQAAVLAHLVGMNADGRLRSQVHTAIQNVLIANREPAQAIDARSLVAPGQGTPNLITNLAEVIRQQRSQDQRFIRAVQVDNEGSGFISVDAIGGAVRARFAGRRFVDPSDDAVTTAAGALLLGYSLAEPEIAARRRANPAGWTEGVYSLPRPWQAGRPIFLDPVLWMPGTALPEN